MDQIHLENLGKSAKVVLKRLPPNQPDPPIIEKTSAGPIVPLRVINGVNAALDYQFIANPGYNPDRGPVSVFGVRLHGEF